MRTVDLRRAFANKSVKKWGLTPSLRGACPHFFHGNGFCIFRKLNSMIEFTCCKAQCRILLRVGDDLRGKPVKCPQCGQIQIAAAPPEVIHQVLDAIETKAPPARQNLELANEEILEVLPVPVQKSIPPARTEALDEDRYRNVRQGPKSRRNIPFRSYRQLSCPFCSHAIEPDEMRYPTCSRDISDQSLAPERMRLQSQRRTYQLLSFIIGLPGLGMQATMLPYVGSYLPWVMSFPSLDSTPWWAWLLFVAGCILLWIGIACAVLYKHDNAVWALLGLPGLIGLIILCCIPDQKGKRLSLMKRLLDARDYAREQ